jgi:hypothetical protein
MELDHVITFTITTTRCHTDVPSGLEVPGIHSEQLALPTVSLNFPRGQDTHDGDPADALYCPNEHASHVVPPGE